MKKSSGVLAVCVFAAAAVGSFAPGWSVKDFYETMKNPCLVGKKKQQ